MAEELAGVEAECPGCGLQQPANSRCLVCESHLQYSNIPSRGSLPAIRLTVVNPAETDVVPLLTSEKPSEAATKPDNDGDVDSTDLVSYICIGCSTVYQVPPYVVKFACTKCKRDNKVNVEQVPEVDVDVTSVPPAVIWAFRASSAVMVGIWIYVVVIVAGLWTVDWVKSSSANTGSPYFVKNNQVQIACHALSPGGACEVDTHCTSYCDQASIDNGTCVPHVRDTVIPYMMFTFTLLFFSVAVFKKASSAYSLKTNPQQWVIKGLWGFNLRKLPNLQELREAQRDEFAADALWMRTTGIPVMLGILKYFCLDPIFAVEKACGTVTLTSKGIFFVVLAFSCIYLVMYQAAKRFCPVLVYFLDIVTCFILLYPLLKCFRCARVMWRCIVRSLLLAYMTGFLVVLAIAYNINTLGTPLSRNPHWVVGLKVLNYLGLCCELYTLYLIKWGTNDIVRLRSTTQMQRYLYRLEAKMYTQPRAEEQDPSTPHYVKSTFDISQADRPSHFAAPDSREMRSATVPTQSSAGLQADSSDSVGTYSPPSDVPVRGDGRRGTS